MARFSLEEVENGSSPSLLHETQRHKYLCLEGAAYVFFLFHTDPGHGWTGLLMVSKVLNRTGEVISGMSKPEQ